MFVCMLVKPWYPLLPVYSVHELQPLIRYFARVYYVHELQPLMRNFARVVAVQCVLEQRHAKTPTPHA